MAVQVKPKASTDLEAEFTKEVFVTELYDEPLNH